MALCKSGKWLSSNRKAGGWAVVAGGDKPSGKVGGKRVGLGRSELFSRNKELSGHCQEVCLLGEGYLCDMSHQLVCYPWVVEPGPGPTTVDQTISVASPLLGLGMLCLAGTVLAVGKDVLQLYLCLNPTAAGVELFPFSQWWTSPGGDYKTGIVWKRNRDNSWIGWGAGWLCMVEGGRESVVGRNRTAH